MKKTILTMTKKQVAVERFKLEQAGLIADVSWYLGNLIYQLKKERGVKHV